MRWELRSSWCQVTLAGALLASCGDGIGRNPQIDAPSVPIDAALMIDAAVMIDAPPDAPVDAPSRVVVTVLRNDSTGKPDTFAMVIFADPSNHLVDEGFVDASGNVSADLPGGGLVHVVHAHTLSTTSRRVDILSMRVQPGDHLTFGTAARLPRGTPISVAGMFTPIENVSTPYSFASPCGRTFLTSTEGSVGLVSVTGCLPATFDVLGTSVAPNHLPVQQFVWFKATPAAAFAAPAMADMQPFTAVVNGVPAGSTVDVIYNTALPPYFESAHASGITGPAAGTTVTLVPFYTPPPVDVTAIGIVDVEIRATPLGSPVQSLLSRVAGSAASAVIDLEELPLPVAQSAPTLSGKVVSWTQTGSGAPDVREVLMSSSYAIGTMIYAVNWTVIDGDSSNTVELPGLPATLADFDPTQQPAPTPVSGRVRYFNYSNVQGFEAARRLPLGSLTGDGVPYFGDGLFAGELFSVRVTTN